MVEKKNSREYVTILLFFERVTCFHAQTHSQEQFLLANSCRVNLPPTVSSYCAPIKHLFELNFKKQGRTVPQFRNLVTLHIMKFGVPDRVVWKGK